MAYDLSKINVGTNGMVQTGIGSFVNVNNLSEQGYKQALDYQLNKDVVKRGEPSILSSSAGRNAFDRNITPIINNANNALTQAQTNRQNQQDKTETTKDTSTLLAEEGESEEDKLNRQMMESLERQRKDAQAVFDNITIANTLMAQGEIQSLTNSWNQRKAALEKSNKANVMGWNQQFIRSGQSEYSPGMTGDFLSAKEQEGLQKITDLDVEYNGKISQINKELQAGKLTAAAILTEELNKIEEKALTLMKEQAKEATKINKEIKNRQIQASRDSVIADLVMRQGVTEAADLLEILNYDESGKFTGDWTAEEVDKALKIFNPDASLTGLDSDYRTYKYLKDQNDPVVEGLSWLEYKQAVYNATHKGDEGGNRNEYILAEEYINSNPEATDEELKSSLLRDSEMPVSEINAIVANRKNKITLTDVDTKNIGVELIEENFDKKFWSGRSSELDDAKEKAKKEINNLNLSEGDRKKLEKAIDDITIDDIEVK